MHKSILTTLIIAILFIVPIACQHSSAGKEVKNTESADSLKKVDSLAALALLNSAPQAPQKPAGPVYDGILLGEDVRLFKDTIPGQEPVEQLGSMSVEIVQKSEFMDPGSEVGSCSAYYWYFIKTKDGKSGWVKGFELKKKASELSDYWPINKGWFNQAFQLNGKQYFVEGAVEMDIDLSGQDYMECAIMMTLYLYDDQGKIYFIDYDMSKYGTHPGHTEVSPYGYLQLVLSSDGGRADFTAISQTSKDGTDCLEFDLSHSYQDGGETSELYVSKGESGFAVFDHKFNTKEQ